ncbi:hypothetical protein NOJ64_000561 [Salmonella enterica]|nr:hypothetical protein [Salmonella enterica]EJV3811447.1 hypothetical protein [Salmonella enterica]
MHPTIKKQIECIAEQLIDSGLLKTSSELKITDSALKNKLFDTIELGITMFNKKHGRRGPGGVRL